MAKIRNHYFKAWTVTVSYMLKKESFQINLPQEMIAFAEMDPAGHARGGHVTDKTEAGAVKKFEDLAARYLVEGVKREKYLAIGVESSRDDRSSFHDDFQRADGKQAWVGISWAIVQRVEAGGQAVYKYTEGRAHPRESNFTQDAFFIPWTPSREAFLKSTTDSLQATAERVKAFFESESLPTNIDLKKTPLITTKDAK